MTFLRNKLAFLALLSIILSILLIYPNLTSNKTIVKKSVIILSYEDTSVKKLEKRMPNALIIGVAKCGTDALIQFIGAHPEVAMQEGEINYFNTNYEKGPDWYREQMPLSLVSQTTMEKSPQYFVDDKVPERVFQFNPKMKLIVIVRDTVARAVSHYFHFKHTEWHNFVNDTLLVNLTDSERLKMMLYPSEGVIRADWILLRHGLYFEQIQRFLRYFPLEQILFVNGEQLLKEPSVEMYKLQSFLNLKPIIKKEHFVYNIRKGFPCIVNPMDASIVNCLAEEGVHRKGQKHPPLDTSILEDLRKFYRLPNQKFFQLINQSPWWDI